MYSSVLAVFLKYKSAVGEMSEKTLLNEREFNFAIFITYLCCARER